MWPCHLHEKIILRLKKRIMETQIFHTAKKKKKNLQKNPLKETSMVQDIRTL
jgi:hypothetical protein